MPRVTTAEPTPFPSQPGAPRRALLKDRAYADLKVLIQSGEFPPNTFLSERQLVARLGMSKTPIRSALEHLEAQGLVVVSPQQGIVVTDLSVREITDLFDVRSAIEPFVAARLAERHVGAEGIARLDENLLLQANAASAGDALAATSLDVAFHALLAELLDNREVLRWLARCFDKPPPFDPADQSSRPRSPAPEPSGPCRDRRIHLQLPGRRGGAADDRSPWLWPPVPARWRGAGHSLNRTDRE